MSQAAALTQLAKQCAADTVPKLTTDDLIDLLGQARRVDGNGYDPDPLPDWEPNRVYAVGEVVVPTVRNGYYYRVAEVVIPIEDPIPPAASGATEPAWSTTLGEAVSDGYIVWQVAGRAYWAETYDLDWATVQAWELKAGKATSMISLSDNGQTINREPIYTHCTQQADRWRRRLYGSALVSTYTNSRASLVPPL